MAVDSGQRVRRRGGQELLRLPRVPVREVGRFHRATMPAGKALGVVLIALLLGGMLNSRSLVEAAERQPFGLERDVALVLVWPFKALSGLLGLDQPRALLTERLGRDLDAGAAGGGETAPVGDATDDPTAAPAPAASPGAGGIDALAAAAALAGREAEGPRVEGATSIPLDVDPDAPALAEAAELPERLQATFTLEDPLSIAVIGDSITEQLGPAIIDHTTEPGVPATAIHDFRYSSGLTRPDFFDWPAQAAQIAEETDPDLWIVMLGANDAQDVRNAGGRFLHLGEDAWEAIYSARIGDLMDQLTAEGRGVIWVGQPIMRDADFDESMAYLSSLYEREAARRPVVSFVDARAVFATEEGTYADYLPAPDGQLDQMRLPDGIHLTRSGAQRLAEQIFPLLPIDPVSPSSAGATEATSEG